MCFQCGNNLSFISVDEPDRRKGEGGFFLLCFWPFFLSFVVHLPFLLFLLIDLLIFSWRTRSSRRRRRGSAASRILRSRTRQLEKKIVLSFLLVKITFPRSFRGTWTKYFDEKLCEKVMIYDISHSCWIPRNEVSVTNYCQIKYVFSSSN